MSDSLTIRVDHAVTLDARDLFERAGLVLRSLLNQGEDFLPEFQMARLSKGSIETVSTIEPGDNSYVFFEHKYMHRGMRFSYGMDPDWNLYSDKTIFQFCITEIKRDFSNINLIFCISIAISVAQLFSVDEIIDWYGVWVVGGDEVSVDRLLGLAVEKRLSVEDAMEVFYKKIPIRM